MTIKVTYTQLSLKKKKKKGNPLFATKNNNFDSHESHMSLIDLKSNMYTVKINLKKQLIVMNNFFFFLIKILTWMAYNSMKVMYTI